MLENLEDSVGNVSGNQLSSNNMDQDQLRAFIKKQKAQTSDLSKKLN